MVVVLLFLSLSHVSLGRTNGPAQIGRTEKTVSELIQNLNSPNGREVFDAFRALGEMGERAEPAIPQLMVFLRDPQATFVVTNFYPLGHILPPVRRFQHTEMAQQTLVQIGPVTVPYLLKALSEHSPPFQHNTVLVLGWLAQKNGLGAQVDLEAVKKAPSEFLQKNAAGLTVEDLKTIGFTKCPEATQELISRLQTNTNYETRAWSALALGELKAPEGLTVLKKVLAEDRVYLVRQFSAQALGHLQQPEATSGALAVALLEDKEAEVRAACAEALQGARSPEAIKALVQALGDESAKVRLNAVQAFHRVKSKEAVPALMKALEKETEYLTRNYILTALARQKAAEALPLIEQILQDNSKSASHDAARFIKEVLTGKRPLDESEQAN